MTLRPSPPVRPRPAGLSRHRVRYAGSACSGSQQLSAIERDDRGSVHGWVGSAGPTGACTRCLELVPKAVRRRGRLQRVIVTIDANIIHLRSRGERKYNICSSSRLSAQQGGGALMEDGDWQAQGLWRRQCWWVGTQAHSVAPVSFVSQFQFPISVSVSVFYLRRDYNSLLSPRRVFSGCNCPYFTCIPPVAHRFLGIPSIIVYPCIALYISSHVGGWGSPVGCSPPCGVSPRGVWGLPLSGSFVARSC